MAAILAGLATAAARLGTFLVQLVGFLVVLGIGWIIARVVQSAIAGILHRLRFDNLVERGGVKTALARTGWDASGILGRIAFWAVMLFTLQFAFGVFGANPVSGVLNSLIAYLPRVFAAALIVIIGAAVAGFVRDAVDAAVGGVGYGRTLAAFAGGAVLYVAAFMALDELAIATSIVTGLFYASLAAIAGTIVVAAGGGGIPVMQQWWQRASQRVETEAPAMMEQVQGASERIKERTQERVEQVQEAQREPAGTRSGGAGTMPPRDGERKS
ncbi:MAG TPA: hypothetical protein VGK50_04420 [Coriobacteriia bacterium]